MAGGGGDEEEDEEPRGTNKAGHSGRTGWTGRWGAGYWAEEATGVQVRSRAQAWGGGSERGPGCGQPEDSERTGRGVAWGLETGQWVNGDGRTGDGIGSEVWDFGVERQNG